MIPIIAMCLVAVVIIYFGLKFIAWGFTADDGGSVIVGFVVCAIGASLLVKVLQGDL